MIILSFVPPSLSFPLSLYSAGAEKSRGQTPHFHCRGQIKTPSVSDESPHPTHTIFLLHTGSSLTISNSLTPTLSVSPFPMFLTLSQSSLRGIKFFICCFLSLLSLHYLTLIFSPLSYFFALITFPFSSFWLFPSKFF